MHRYGVDGSVPKAQYSELTSEITNATSTMTSTTVSTITDVVTTLVYNEIQHGQGETDELSSRYELLVCS
jgi:hypothetical protein